MFPHFFGFDFSAALPWTLAGFIAGLFLSWLLRALRSSRLEAKADAKISQVQALFEAKDSDRQAEISRLVADTRSYEVALADAEQRALKGKETAGALTRDLEALRTAELSSRNELLAADAELGKLRGAVQRYEADLAHAAEAGKAAVLQLQSAGADRHAMAADLASARTAAELKDSEIARLINQVQWTEQRVSDAQQQLADARLHAATLEQKASALEVEKFGLASGMTNLKSTASGKQEEVFRLQDELGAARAHGDRLESALATLQPKLQATETHLEETSKDLTYLRNLAYWQTAEIDRMRGVVSKAEDDLAAKRALLGNVRKRNVAGTQGTRAAAGQRKVSGPFPKSSAAAANGSPAPSGEGTVFVSRRGKGNNAAKKAARVHGYKPGRAIVFGNARADGESRGLEPLWVARRHAPVQTSPPQSNVELAALRERVAQLTSEADSYRRFREALEAANRIAGSG